MFGDVDRFLRCVTNLLYHCILLAGAVATSWRVGLMERGLRHVDFTTVDSMVQVHDYAGASRDANSKRAAAAASQLFTDHYPELLVSLN